MLKGKRVVLLGGTSGFGFATAEAALREGAEVVLASSRQEKVDSALSRLARLGDGATGHTVDLTDEGQIATLFERIGAFDHLVYTAGDSLRLEPLASLRFADARRAFEIRYWGPTPPPSTVGGPFARAARSRSPAESSASDLGRAGRPRRASRARSKP